MDSMPWQCIQLGWPSLSPCRWTHQGPRRGCHAVQPGAGLDVDRSHVMTAAAFRLALLPALLPNVMSLLHLLVAAVHTSTTIVAVYSMRCMSSAVMRALWSRCNRANGCAAALAASSAEGLLHCLQRQASRVHGSGDQQAGSVPCQHGVGPAIHHDGGSHRTRRPPGKCRFGVAWKVQYWQFS